MDTLGGDGLTQGARAGGYEDERPGPQLVTRPSCSLPGCPVPPGYACCQSHNEENAARLRAYAVGRPRLCILQDCSECARYQGMLPEPPEVEPAMLACCVEHWRYSLVPGRGGELRSINGTGQLATPLQLVDPESPVGTEYRDVRSWAEGVTTEKCIWKYCWSSPRLLDGLDVCGGLACSDKHWKQFQKWRRQLTPQEWARENSAPWSTYVELDHKGLIRSLLRRYEGQEGIRRTVTLTGFVYRGRGSLGTGVGERHAEVDERTLSMYYGRRPFPFDLPLCCLEYPPTDLSPSLQWRRTHECSSGLQAMALCLAARFGDYETFCKIRRSTEVDECMLHMQQVYVCDAQIWANQVECVGFSIAQQMCVKAPGFMETLLHTDDKYLVIADSADLVWGAGARLHSSSLLDAQEWRGQNIWGRALMEVRNAIQGECRQRRCPAGLSSATLSPLSLCPFRGIVRRQSREWLGCGEHALVAMSTSVVILRQRAAAMESWDPPEEELGPRDVARLLLLAAFTQAVGQGLGITLDPQGIGSFPHLGSRGEEGVLDTTAITEISSRVPDAEPLSARVDGVVRRVQRLVATLPNIGVMSSLGCNLSEAEWIFRSALGEEELDDEVMRAAYATVGRIVDELGCGDLSAPLEDFLPDLEEALAAAGPDLCEVDPPLHSSRGTLMTRSGDQPDVPGGSWRPSLPETDVYGGSLSDPEVEVRRLLVTASRPLTSKRKAHLVLTAADSSCGTNQDIVRASGGRALLLPGEYQSSVRWSLPGGGVVTASTAVCRTQGTVAPEVLSQV